jgi:anti-sigma regulatory factor (Ser/Thr protein kinase)
MLRQFGLPSPEILESAKASSRSPDVIYEAVLDEPALWDPSTLDEIVRDFPASLLNDGDLFLVLSECFANAALHGRAQALAICARKKKGLLLLSFRQSPPMLGRVAIALSIAKNCVLDQKSCDLESGLGFPILLRLAHNATLSLDYTRLQLWFRLNS